MCFDHSDGVLADAILIPPRPPILPTDTAHQYKEGKGSTNTKTIYY